MTLSQLPSLLATFKSKHFCVDSKGQLRLPFFFVPEFLMLQGTCRTLALEK
jgi:hypothetical protein